VNFNSILIGSEDPQRLVDYYTRLFGEPTWRDAGYAGWLIGTGVVSIGAHDQVHGKNVHPGRIIWNIESPDVRGDFERFKGAGAAVVREPYELSDGSEEATIATFADPDDNYFQLVSPMGPDAAG
jgi:predicted enzyme related to lactoylglutathione lyase